MYECANPDTPLVFTSFSKISYPGAGVAAMCCSENNRRNYLRHISIKTVGPNKLNQLRHAKYFRDLRGVEAHMKKMAAVLRPRFNLVLDSLTSGLGGLNTAEWSNPKGGYFISLNTVDGRAKKVVELCRRAGLIITEAGATYPYGNDPHDRNIRIAPSFPELNELELAMKIFCAAVKLAAL
jgi:DNA-binding transcriptional MocR family regulator